MRYDNPATSGTTINVSSRTDASGEHHQGSDIRIIGGPSKLLSSATVSVSSSGDNALVTGTTGQTIKLHSAVLVNDGAEQVKVKFRDGTTDKTAAMPLRPGGSLTLDLRGEPWFVTTSTNPLNLNLSAAVAVAGFIEYTRDALS